MGKDRLMKDFRWYSRLVWIRFLGESFPIFTKNQNVEKIVCLRVLCIAGCLILMKFFFTYSLLIWIGGKLWTISIKMSAFQYLLFVSNAKSWTWSNVPGVIDAPIRYDVT